MTTTVSHAGDRTDIVVGHDDTESGIFLRVAGEVTPRVSITSAGVVSASATIPTIPAPPAEEDVYVLTATVDEDGVAVLTWEPAA